MQWQALIYIKTKSVPSRAERYFISVALWYMHFLLVLGRFRDWCCLIHDILFSLASLLLPLIHVYVYLTNNNPNFKALEFLKAKFWPETPFLICYDTSELLEFLFFSITNLQVEHSFLKKITSILSHPPALSQHNIFLRLCKCLYMYSIRGWDWMYYFMHGLMTVLRHFKSMWFLLTETCYRLWKICIHQAHLYLWQQKRNILCLLERVPLPLSCYSASLILTCLKMFLYSALRPSSMQFIYSYTHWSYCGYSCGQGEQVLTLQVANESVQGVAILLHNNETGKIAFV